MSENPWSMPPTEDMTDRSDTGMISTTRAGVTTAAAAIGCSISIVLPLVGVVPVAAVPGHGAIESCAMAGDTGYGDMLYASSRPAGADISMSVAVSAVSAG